MNKHLNNWLDKVEGKPPETSNNAIKKERKRQGYDKETPAITITKQHAYVTQEINKLIT